MKLINDNPYGKVLIAMGVWRFVRRTSPADPAERCQHELMNIAQIAQHAGDLDRAADFYRGLLGVEPAARFDPPGLLFFTLDGTRLLLENGASSATIYFGVDDVRAKVEELRSAGVVILSEPHVIFSHTDDTLGPAGTEEWMAFLEDSEGNTIGLISHGAPT